MPELKTYNIQDVVKSMADLDKVDIHKLINSDPSKIKLGTDMQDAALIAQTYERGSHYTANEASVFATLNRQLTNYRTISKNTSALLKTYTMVPSDSLSSVLANSQQMAQKANVQIPGGAGGGAGTNTGQGVSPQAIGQSIGIKENQQQTNASYGSKFDKWAKDCIPCDLRLKSWLEIHPNVDFGKILSAGLQGIMNFLNGIGDLLRNLDIFGDFCTLMSLFNFLCIPDIQRILMLLSALFMLEIPTLDGLIGMVQALIAPLFSGILNSIVGLLDQFTLLVANPLQCIVDAINMQINKLPKADNPIFGNATQIDPKTHKVTKPATQGVVANAAKVFGVSPQTQQSIQSGSQAVGQAVGSVRNVAQKELADVNALSQGVGQALSILKNFIQAAINRIKALLKYYLGDLKALMGEMAGNDASYIGASLRKLQIIRLISFLTALMTAIASGNVSMCSKEGMPEDKAMNTFFNNYMSANSPFAIEVDANGTLHLRDKAPQVLPKVENVFESNGTDLISQVARNLSTPVMVVKPCKLEVTASEATILNQYITDLNTL